MVYDVKHMFSFIIILGFVVEVNKIERKKSSISFPGLQNKMVSFNLV